MTKIEVIPNVACPRLQRTPRALFSLRRLVTSVVLRSHFRKSSLLSQYLDACSGRKINPSVDFFLIHNTYNNQHRKTSSSNERTLLTMKIPQKLGFWAIFFALKTPQKGQNMKNVKKSCNYLKVLILVYHSWKNHSQIKNSFRDMIDNVFQDFPKIDQGQVPASNETMNKT